jgi:transposase-like protein
MTLRLRIALKNGISAHEMHRQLGIAYESAWFMEHRLRHGVAPTTHKRKLADTVEADETYIGGKRKGATSGRPGKDSHKVPVVTLVERNGEARSRALESVTGKNVREMLHTHVEESATIMTDEFPLYHKATEGFAGHGVVTDKDGEYVRGKVHTNTAEGYFSQLKRSLDGTHHHVSAQHLPRYVAEFDFRYNTRKMRDSERAVEAIRRGRGKRLMYRETAKEDGDARRREVPDLN